MIEGIVNKIMLGGIGKYCELFNSENVQIKLSINENKLQYEMCENWQPKEKVTFKDILNKKIDILGYEALATPVLIQSIEFYSKSRDILLEEVNLFLFKTKNNKIALAIYNKFENVGMVKLSDHLEKIGL